MNKHQILSRVSIVALCLGIFIWALFVLPAGAIVFLIIILIAAYVDYRRCEKNKLKGPNSELNVDGLIEKYGNPDDIIVANPTRGNEVGGCVLVYREKGFLIINGLEVKKSEITDYLLKNTGFNPYLPPDYQLYITTTLEDYPLLTVSLGNEVSWANEVLKQFQLELAA